LIYFFLSTSVIGIKTTVIFVYCIRILLHVFFFILSPVLKKRAVQLVINRGNNQMHRTLVNNFSFMDFPLHESADAFSARMMMDPSLQNTDPSQPQLFERVALDKDSALGVQVDNMSWRSQVSSFEKQLDEMLSASKLPTERRTHSIVIDDSHLFGGASTATKTSGGGGGAAATAESVGSVSRVEKVTDSVKNPFSEVSESVLLSPLSAGLSVKTQADPERTVKCQEISPVDEPSLSKMALKKTTEKKKPTKTTQQELIEMNEDFDPETMADIDAEFLAEDEHHIQHHHHHHHHHHQLHSDRAQEKAVSRTVLHQLQKARKDQEKFQSDPAKFNHIFNQELLAYVDACCFSGLVSH
jgi:hypothetical protein